MDHENKRFKEIRNFLKLSQENFGDAIGLSKSGISNIENGIRKVTDQHIKLLTSAFNLNENWLRTGEGDMFVESATFSLDEHAKKSNLTELEIAIMRGYMELDQSTRENIVSKLESILQQRSNETAATTVEDNIEAEVEKELDLIRQELLDEKKAKMLSASPEQKGLLG